jgi:hypothetical protein
MFLPKIVASIPTLLDDLLTVLNRCICWKLSKEQKVCPPSNPVVGGISDVFLLGNL